MPPAIANSIRRVLICAKGWPPDYGGIQSYGEHVARACLRAGIEPVVVSARPGPRGWTDLDYPEGRIRMWNAGQGSQALLFARMLAASRRILRSERFDHVHATTWRAALAVAPWRRRTPLAITVHGREVLAASALARPAMRAVLRRAALVVAVSRSTRDAARAAMSGTGGARWIASFNGLSYAAQARTAERPPTGERVRIFTLCRLVARKNVVGALSALAMLRSRGIEDFDYAIAGDGPERAAIAQAIVDLGLQDRVTMAGTIAEDEVSDAHLATDIFLHPQTAPEGGRDIEGFGLVIADAMSLGALAIAGKAGGPADFIRNGDTALLVDGDDPAAIAAGLEAMIRDPDRRARIAAAGRAWCNAHLSWDTHVADILAGLE